MDQPPLEPPEDDRKKAPEEDDNVIEILEAPTLPEVVTSVGNVARRNPETSSTSSSKSSDYSLTKDDIF